MTKEKTMIRDLTVGSVPKKLLTFAYPFMIANALQIFYNLVDMVIVGNYVGSAALSGVSTGGELLNFCTFMGFGFSSAGQVMIAQCVGKKDREAVKKTIGTLFTIMAAMAVALTAVALIFADVFLDWMNTPAEALDQARQYAIVGFSGIFFVFGYNTVSAILRGMGDSKRPFIFISVAALLNIGLDLLFVGVFKWESRGAALATIMGQGVSFISALIYLYIKRDSFGFDFKLSSFGLHKGYIAPLLKLGAPMAMQSVALNISMMIVFSLINTYGVAASAVTGVGSKLKQFVGIVARAMMTAGSAMVGQNMGAGKPERVKEIVRTGIILVASVTAVICVIFMLFPVGIFRLFNGEAEVLAYAKDYMKYVVLTMVAMALMTPFLAVINGVGNSMLAFISGLLDGIVARVGISLLLVYVFHMGLHGFWLGDALASFVMLGVSLGYYLSGKWQHRKLMIRERE